MPVCQTRPFSFTASAMALPSAQVFASGFSP